jgi:hypothetical protein
VELAYSLVVATTPCLKPFMSTISTNWGEAPKTEFTDSNPSGSYRLTDLFGRSNKMSSNFSQRTAQAVIPERESQGTLAADWSDGFANKGLIVV